MISGFSQTFAVARKDFRSELRSRYGLQAIGMFVATVVIAVSFSIGPERLEPAVTAGLLWICFFFTAVTGLSRSYLAEQERGTMLLLRLTLNSTPVYFGKLLFNVTLSVGSNLAIVLLFTLFNADDYHGSLGGLCLLSILISIGLAAAVTTISALLTRASAQGTLSTVLSFPLILPLLFLGHDLLSRGADGKGLDTMAIDLLLILAYAVVVVSLSYVLLDLIWKE